MISYLAKLFVWLAISESVFILAAIAAGFGFVPSNFVIPCLILGVVGVVSKIVVVVCLYPHLRNANSQEVSR